MSSTAKKPGSRGLVSVAKTADHSANDGQQRHPDDGFFHRTGRIFTTVIAPDETALPINPQSELIQRTGELISSALPDVSICLAVLSRDSKLATVEWTSGDCLELKGTQFDTQTEIFATLLKNANGQLHQIDPRRAAFPLSASPEGSALISRLDLGNRTHLFVSLHKRTGFTDDLGAVKAVATSALNLAQIAASHLVRQAETTIQAERLESLRSEVADLHRFYQRFSTAIQQCFWVMELDTARVTTVSDNFEQVWGTSRQILSKESLTGFATSVYPDDRDRVLAEFHTHFGSELSLEFRVVDTQGEIRWIWLRSSPTYIEFNRAQNEEASERAIRQALFIADDVTERKLEEERIRDREATLVTHARTLAVGDLASGVAHEINNPLTIIAGKASELKRQFSALPPTPETTKYIESVEKIQSTAIRISKIISSLKAVARREDPGFLMKMSFAPIVNEIRDLLSARFNAHHVKLEFNQPETGINAEMNPTMISQVILNLVNNAFDAVAEHPEKWVTIDLTEDKDSVYISVTDSGPGIPIKNRGRIFDPFFTTKGPIKGTGLGLSLSASIAAHHYGSLRLDTLNAHTRFVLQLPKKQPPKRKTA